MDISLLMPERLAITLSLKKKTKQATERSQQSFWLHQLHFQDFLSVGGEDLSKYQIMWP